MTTTPRNEHPLLANQVGQVWVLMIERTSEDNPAFDRSGDLGNDWIIGAFKNRPTDKEVDELVEAEIWSTDKDEWLELAEAELEDEPEEAEALDEEGKPMPKMTREQRIERKAKQLLEDEMYGSYEWDVYPVNLY